MSKPAAVATFALVERSKYGFVFAKRQALSYPNEMDRALLALARHLFWWKTPEEALTNQNRFLAQVMTYGTWQDILEARQHFGEPAFRAVLQQAPPGVFDKRSWTYWHHALHLAPVPPLPQRKLPDGL